MTKQTEAACYWCDAPTTNTVKMSFPVPSAWTDQTGIEEEIHAMCPACAEENGYHYARPDLPAAHADDTAAEDALFFDAIDRGGLSALLA